LGVLGLKEEEGSSLEFLRRGYKVCFILFCAFRSKNMGEWVYVRLLIKEKKYAPSKKENRDERKGGMNEPSSYRKKGGGMNEPSSYSTSCFQRRSQPGLTNNYIASVSNMAVHHTIKDNDYFQSHR
jgi:hypothetical protein